MALVDKKSIVEKAIAGETFAFELGCGTKKQDPAAVGIDMLDLDTVDIVGEIFEVLAVLPDSCATSIYAAHFFEHIADLPRLMAEIARMMRSGAKLTVIVPHFSNPFYYSDPTHRTPFGLYTLAYCSRQRLFVRTIPEYGIGSGLKLRSVDLGFKSYPPRHLRHAIKKVLGVVFNSSMFLREFYEENLCWIVPCYEVRYVLVKE